MEVLYHIRPYSVGIFPEMAIDYTNDPHFVWGHKKLI